MKSLITQLKAINQRMIDFSDGNDTVHTIALSLSTKLPEIISTLEAQEERLKILEGADKAYFDQIPYVDSLVEKLARQEKLLGEAQIFIRSFSKMYCSSVDCRGTDQCLRCEVEAKDYKQWLAALSKESDEK